MIDALQRAAAVGGILQLPRFEAKVERKLLGALANPQCAASGISLPSRQK